jgi:membrane protein DedA with SNARE-associated domain
MFYTIFKHTHSGLRWFLLIALLSVIVMSIVQLAGKKQYKESIRKLALFTLIFSHVQLLVGMVLYFLSPKVIFAAESMKNAMLRFFLVEHIGLMIVALVLITMGYSKAKKALTQEAKLKKTLLFYGLGLLLILLAIPWPWQQYAAAWF